MQPKLGEWAWELVVIEWGTRRIFRLRMRARGEGERVLEVPEAEVPARLHELAARLGMRAAPPPVPRKPMSEEARANYRASWTPERRARQAASARVVNERRWARARGETV